MSAAEASPEEQNNNQGIWIIFDTFLLPTEVLPPTSCLTFEPVSYVRCIFQHSIKIDVKNSKVCLKEFAASASLFGR